MKEKYIPAAAAYRKLNYAHDMGNAVYMYGATGYGKTRMVKEFIGSSESVWLSVTDEEWDVDDIYRRSVEEKELCVVIDDLQLLNNDEHREKIIGLIESKKVWVVLIGRMSTPQWMVSTMANGNLMVIPEESFMMATAEVAKIAKQRGIALTEQELEYITGITYGNVYVISTALQFAKSGMKVDDSFRQQLEELFEDHLKNVVIPQWSVDIQDFLMKLSVVDEFTLPLAVMITGDDQAALMLSEANQVGNFLIKDGEIYKLRPQLTSALRKRALEYFGLNEYRRYISNAGLFYETQDDIINALKMYEKCERKENIKSLLVRNGRRHAGAGYYYELRHYYMSLDDKDVENSPILMSAMSLLYSILLNPEKSEYWYDRLKAYAGTVKAGEKKEADELLLYLDISLPHRGSGSMVDILKTSLSLMRSGGFRIPELSVTNNCPTTMNGGKDFCEWSKRDQFLADTIGKVIEKVNGSMGRGLVHAALCESFYEKGDRDAEVAHHAMLVHMDVEGGGKNEILFAAVGIQARLSIVTGNKFNALQIVEAFTDRIKDYNNIAMRNNLAAFRCRLALVLGEDDIVRKWMEEAPNELVDFCVLERYRYMTKIRCYLANGKNKEAIELSNKMRYYAERYQRNYIHMETGILLAIAYRREGTEWRELFLDTLREVSQYKFVRILSEKGAGILPLLKEIKKSYLVDRNEDTVWYNNVLRETEEIAERYPGYLDCDTAQPSDFSDTAMSIIKKQAEGLSIKEIAKQLGMSERTIKYHAAENYRKLGAKGKTDAVQKAKSMNLI